MRSLAPLGRGLGRGVGSRLRAKRFCSGRLNETGPGVPCNTDFILIARSAFPNSGSKTTKKFSVLVKNQVNFLKSTFGNCAVIDDTIVLEDCITGTHYVFAIVDNAFLVDAYGIKWKTKSKSK